MEFGEVWGGFSARFGVAMGLFLGGLMGGLWVGLARFGADYWEALGWLMGSLGPAWVWLMGSLGPAWVRLRSGLWVAWVRLLGWLSDRNRIKNCKKLQKNCIFLHFFLHISKKNSTFVADLGIVLILTY